MRKNLISFSLVLAVTLAVSTFQACSNIHFEETSSKIEQSLSVPLQGNGDSYPGKPQYFALEDTANVCSRLSNLGRPFPRREIFSVNGVFTLVRDNCKDITPVVLDATSVQYDAATQTLVYQGERFDLKQDLSEFNQVPVVCPAGTSVSTAQGNFFTSPLELVAPAWKVHPEVPVGLGGSIEALPNFLIQVQDPNLLESWRRISQNPFLSPNSQYVATFLLKKGTVDHATIASNEGGPNDRQFVIDVDLTNLSAQVQWQNGGANPVVTSVQAYGSGLAVSVAFTTGPDYSAPAGDLGVAPYHPNNGDMNAPGDSIYATAASLYPCK